MEVKMEKTEVEGTKEMKEAKVKIGGDGHCG